MSEIAVVRVKLVKDYAISISKNEIHSAKDAAIIFDEIIGNSTLEKVTVLCLDSNNRATNLSVVNIGTSTKVNFVSSEIFRIAILSNASSIFICHNHPSGDTRPSEEDIKQTKKIGQIGNLLGINLIDSLILGDNGEYLSLREELRKEDTNEGF